MLQFRQLAILVASVHGIELKFSSATDGGILAAILDRHTFQSLRADPLERLRILFFGEGGAAAVVG